jgi:hypothetical protein
MNKDPKEQQPDENSGETKATEKFFSEEEYSTITIGKEEQAASPAPLQQPHFVKTLLSLLDSGSAEDKESALELLKKENAVAFLLEAIGQTASTDKKAVLLAACWESGLDFKGHHQFFIEYALHVNPLVSLEAITVLDTNRLSIPKAELQGLIDLLSTPAAQKHDNAVLLEDLKIALFEQLREA